MTGLTLEQYLGLCTLDFDVFKDKDDIERIYK